MRTGEVGRRKVQPAEDPEEMMHSSRGDPRLCAKLWAGGSGRVQVQPLPIML